jgi:hypothetical protein
MSVFQVRSGAEKGERQLDHQSTAFLSFIAAHSGPLLRRFGPPLAAYELIHRCHCEHLPTSCRCQMISGVHGDPLAGD